MGCCCGSTAPDTGTPSSAPAPSAARRMNVQQAALSLHARTSTLSSVHGAAASLTTAASSLRFLFAARSRGRLDADASPWRRAAAKGSLAVATAAEEAGDKRSDAAVLKEACLAARKASAALRLALLTDWLPRAVSSPSGPSAAVGSGDSRYGVDAGDSLSDGELDAPASCARRGTGVSHSLQLVVAHCLKDDETIAQVASLASQPCIHIKQAPEPSRRRNRRGDAQQQPTNVKAP